MRVSLNIFLTCFIIVFTGSINARTPETENFYSQIKKYDLSRLWRSDSIRTEGDGEKIPFPEPLGFIGDNYQRFYIHYISVTKSKDDPYLYKVTGKTRVKDNICNFKGEIFIKYAGIYSEQDFEGYKEGLCECQLTFYEDSSQLSAGVIKGDLRSEFYLDKKGRLWYDALNFAGDGFYNNQCTATWTSFKTGKSKKCNWGDYRIPDSRALDAGTGEFMVDEKYIKNGWESYSKAWNSYHNPVEAKAARKEEERKWWK